MPIFTEKTRLFIIFLLLPFIFLMNYTKVKKTGNKKRPLNASDL